MAFQFKQADANWSLSGLDFIVSSGSPSIVAAKGSLYIRTDGSTTATRMYVNVDGTSGGWASVTTSS